MKKSKILIVDDEQKIARLIAANMRSVGYEVYSVLSGLEALDMMEKSEFDLMILDVMMPGMDGFEVLTKIREFSDIPVIMLTARDSASDKLSGFRSGADDYVTKPFSIEELIARVNAIIKRIANHGIKDEVNRQICGGMITISFAKRKIYLSQQEIELTDTEFKLFSVLTKNAGKVLTHEQLLTTVWGAEYQDSVEYLRVTIARIRQKINRYSPDLQVIRTRTGVGYYVDE